MLHWNGSFTTCCFDMLMHKERFVDSNVCFVYIHSERDTVEQ